MALSREHLAARLVEIREARHLNQREAAQRAGLSERQWTRLERQLVAKPHLSTLDKISEAFGLEDGDLLGLAPRTPAPDLLYELRVLAGKLDAVLEHLGVPLPLPPPPAELIDGPPNGNQRAA